MLGQVQVNNLNLVQGPLEEIERCFLFIGRGAGTNEDGLQTVNTDTDMDTVLGAGDSNLKKQIVAAALNAGQNFYAYVYPLAEGTSWSDAVDDCMELASVEAIVITDPVDSGADVEAMQNKAVSIMSKYMRPLFFIPAVAPIDPATETWTQYATRAKAIVTGLACDQVSVVSPIWPTDQGVYAGRLCDSSVTVADSPMRVITGPLQGSYSARPVDSAGRVVDMSIVKDLNDARLTLPQWYADYPGVYWTDGEVLDIPGGDYQAIENLRVVQKAMRRVYPLAVARIADRKLNSSPKSIAQNKTYFMRPLREMCKVQTILGTTFPGEIMPPEEGDIVINWPSKYSVEIWIAVRPYNSPKKITMNLLLDLSNAAD